MGEIELTISTALEQLIFEYRVKERVVEQEMEVLLHSDHVVQLGIEIFSLSGDEKFLSVQEILDSQKLCGVDIRKGYDKNKIIAVSKRTLHKPYYEYDLTTKQITRKE